MKNPQIELRLFSDGSWSIQARLWDPQKQFFEHPTHINLTKEQALKRLEDVVNENPTIEDIKKSWEYLGD